MTGSTVSQPISNLSLMDLREKFGLERDRTDPFFKEWLAQSSELSSFEQQALNRLRQNYRSIIETNPLEEVVKLVVVAPLLDLAGFYQPPFSIKAEAPTRLNVEDRNETFTGKIDVLVVSQKFWVLVIESKQSQLDILSGIPQALSYLLSQPHNADGVEAELMQRDRPLATLRHRFGMVTNGREVVFLKLTPLAAPVYAQSKAYQVIEEEDDLLNILQGLKWIGHYASGNMAP